MHPSFQKVARLAAVTTALLATPIALSDTANAHWRGRGFGWGGPAFVGGLALGALAAPRYGYGYGYGYPAYGAGYYGGDCFMRRRIVGYTPYGRPIFRVRRICY